MENTHYIENFKGVCHLGISSSNLGLLYLQVLALKPTVCENLRKLVIYNTCSEILVLHMSAEASSEEMLDAIYHRYHDYVPHREFFRLVPFTSQVNMPRCPGDEFAN